MLAKDWLRAFQYGNCVGCAGMVEALDAGSRYVCDDGGKEGTTTTADVSSSTSELMFAGSREGNVRCEM